MTTDRQLHPSELAQLLRTRTTTKSVAVGLLAAALLLLAGGGRALSPESKLWLFGGAFGCGLMCRIVNRVASDHDELFSDATDISLTNWQNRLFKLTRNTDLVVAELATTEPTVELMPLFNWQELSDEDEHPVIALVSPMGGGKSRLVKFLAKYAMFETHPNILAFDIYARDNDWQNAATDHQSMLDAMKNDLLDIEQRLPQYRNGQSEFVPQVRVLEEAVDSLPAICAQNKTSAAVVEEWLRKHVSVARKLKYRLMLVSVKMSGNDIGIGAESRDDATIIFPGAKGVAKAFSDVRYLKLGTKQNTEVREQLRHTLATLQRPALVYHGGEWFPASIPDLTGSGDPVGTVPMLAPSATALDPDTLDSILSLCDRLALSADNCTPGRVRKYCRGLSDFSDGAILDHFQALHNSGRATFDRTGKTPKISPITTPVAPVALTLQPN
jgi:hypothetical protein